MNDYRPQINPELFYHAKRAGMNRLELSMYVCLLCCEHSRNAPHGLFRYNRAEFAFYWELQISETMALFERLGRVQLNGRPSVIYDNDLLYIPEIAESRRFPDAHKTLYVMRTINDARRQFLYVPSEFPDEEGNFTQVNRAFSAFESAHFDLIKEVVLRNEKEAIRKREERENPSKNGGRNNPFGGTVHPEDLPEFDFNSVSKTA